MIMNTIYNSNSNNSSNSSNVDDSGNGSVSIIPIEFDFIIGTESDPLGIFDIDNIRFICEIDVLKNTHTYTSNSNSNSNNSSNKIMKFKNSKKILNENNIIIKKKILEGGHYNKLANSFINTNTHRDRDRDRDIDSEHQLKVSCLAIRVNVDFLASVIIDSNKDLSNMSTIDTIVTSQDISYYGNTSTNANASTSASTAHNDTNNVELEYEYEIDEIQVNSIVTHLRSVNISAATVSACCDMI